jgi:predicted GH43/DUF377 family glycosyl hydrolase
MKCFYTEGRHLLDLWLSLARRMEHWPFHDVIFGAITVCSSFPDILGHFIKQMMSTRQSLIQFTHTAISSTSAYSANYFLLSRGVPHS